MYRSFYVGTSSLEEGLSIEQCCIFRGSLSKLDIKTGALLWQTFTLPDNHGERGEYAGARNGNFAGFPGNPPRPAPIGTGIGTWQSGMGRVQAFFKNPNRVRGGVGCS